MHRVNKILKLSRKEDWSHFPGVENPADLGCREVTASCLNSGEARPTFDHANANFSVFIDRIRINF